MHKGVYRLRTLVGVTVVRLLAAFMMLAANASARAAEDGPSISTIELYQRDHVLIHFDTEPGRSYELQYCSDVEPQGAGLLVWTRIFLAPALSFPSHYIVVDTRTASRRFYRLLVTP